MNDRGFNQLVLHPIGLTVLGLCIIAALLLPRQRVVLALIFIAILIPSAQRLLIGGLDFSFIRIMVLIILVRCFLRGEDKELTIQKPDYFLMFWVGWGILAYGLLRGEFSAVITRTGYMLEVAGAYYIGRVYIRTNEDIQRIVLFLGIVAIPTMIFFLIERSTGKNIFSIFGGVPEITMIRNGRLRCQGPFSHPIMAGIVWASLLPWLAAIWFNRTASRVRVSIYIVCISVIVANTASSTPVMSVLFCLLGLAMFPIHHRISLIWKGGLLLAIVLHTIMDAPIWHLISRIDLSGGSTGYHRYNIIKQSINHFDEWWLIGTLSSRHWGWGMSDITNQYVLEGLRGGFLGMMIFIMFIISVFELLGKRLNSELTRAEQWVIWSSGVMLFVHVMNFLAVSYFGQVTSLFFLFTGAVVSLASDSSKVVDNR